MGLDNGIEIKRTDFTSSIPWIKAFEYNWDKEGKYDFEVCYWRKCWNVRGMIFNVINHQSDNDYQVELSTEDLRAIKEGLQKYNKRTWDESESIWTWEEQKPHIKRQICNLKKLIKLKEKHGNLIEVYFYDSY